jgi:RNA 3'-terminal phosphate cyclase (ATP)
MIETMLTIDGSQGEGGGQILRSSLSLSILTGKPVTISKIRAGRKKPGLMRQHLTAVEAATQISNAEVSGAGIGSTELRFAPKEILSGNYHFRIGTAGSTTLVLQTVLAPLLLANGPSSVTVEGGTHNPFAPPYDFLERAYLPMLRRMGPGLAAEIERYGFYPAGGGKFTVTVDPCQKLRGLTVLERGEILHRRVVALVARLPRAIAKRECDELQKHCNWPQSCFETGEVMSHGPGNILLMEVGYQNCTEVFASNGDIGTSCEKVARDLWGEARKYLASDIPIGPYLADQLILPLGIAASRGETSVFRTSRLTQHSTTHIDLIKQFLPISVDVTPQEERSCLVTIRPA